MSFNVITITVRGMYSLPPGITSILTASQVQLTPTLEAGGITADGKWKSKRNRKQHKEGNERAHKYIRTYKQLQQKYNFFGGSTSMDK